MNATMNSRWVILAVMALSCVLAQKTIKGHKSKKSEEWQEQPDERLTLEVANHKPCYDKPTVYEKIRFPGNDTAMLRKDPDPDRQGCYYIEGTVKVFEELKENTEIYVEYRHNLEDKVPEPCHEPKGDGCGGYGGSCVQCDGCSEQKKYADKIELAEVSLTKDGKEPKCGETLKPGVHDDIKLKFCLPSKKQYIEAQGYDDKTWQRIMDVTAQYKGRSYLPIYIKVYIFSFEVRKIMKNQRQLEAKERERNNIPANEPLPEWIYKTLPFAKFIEKTQLFSGCHSIFGTIALEMGEWGRKK